MHSAKIDWQWWGLPSRQMESEDDDFDDLQVPKPKRKWSGRMEWTAMGDW
jgi:hypothetical protein